MRKLFILLTACIVIGGCSRNENVWDGVYTAPQAARGREIYNSYCVHCHTADLVEGLSGKGFMDDWREDTLKSLFEQTKRRMPADEPSTLSDQQYFDVLAFILKKNGFPEGRKELGTQKLETVLITGRDGPAPLPNGALVQTVGCLTKSAEGSWRLTNASQLVRTRLFRDLTSDEMKLFEKQRLGRDNIVLSTSRFYRFVSRNSDLSPMENRKVVVAGRLVREDSNIHIELARAQEIDRDCKR
jgi:cytochrome c5